MRLGPLAFSIQATDSQLREAVTPLASEEPETPMVQVLSWHLIQLTWYNYSIIYTHEGFDVAIKSIFRGAARSLPFPKKDIVADCYLIYIDWISV